jgi:hypothetical protein
MRAKVLAPVVAAALVWAGPHGVAQQANAAAADPPAVSIQHVMLSRLAPAAEAIWGVAAITTTVTADAEASGPQTDEEWMAVLESAHAIADTYLALTDEDLPVATAEAVAGADPTVDAKAIELRIRASPAAYAAEAARLRDLGLKAAAAAKDRDVAALVELGEQLSDACESCHSKFWYP